LVGIWAKGLRAKAGNVEFCDAHHMEEAGNYDFGHLLVIYRWTGDTGPRRSFKF